MNTTTKSRITRREALVRSVKREHGLKWREIAKALGMKSTGALKMLRSERPQDSTLVAIRDWLAGYGIVVTLNTLLE
jgi:hypothetical protein